MTVTSNVDFPHGRHSSICQRFPPEVPIRSKERRERGPGFQGQQAEVDHGGGRAVRGYLYRRAG